MSSNITVVITTIKTRRMMLFRALRSVYDQQLLPDDVIIVEDVDRMGAAHTRQRGTNAVRTEFVAYLDDDDEMYPQHLKLLRECMDDDASLIYPWFDVIGGQDPFPMHENKPWDFYQIPVTFLARTADIQKAGGWDDGVGEDGVTRDPEGHRAGEDWRLIIRMHELGMRHQHLGARTWAWHHDSGNTSGRPDLVAW